MFYLVIHKKSNKEHFLIFKTGVNYESKKDKHTVYGGKNTFV